MFAWSGCIIVLVRPKMMIFYAVKCQINFFANDKWWGRDSNLGPCYQTSNKIIKLFYERIIWILCPTLFNYDRGRCKWLFLGSWSEKGYILVLFLIIISDPMLCCAYWVESSLCSRLIFHGWFEVLKRGQLHMQLHIHMWWTNDYAHAIFGASPWWDCMLSPHTLDMGAVFIRIGIQQIIFSLFFLLGEWIGYLVVCRSASIYFIATYLLFLLRSELKLV